MDSTDIVWRKSSFSADTGNCIELAVHRNEILLRESDDPGAVLHTSVDGLRALLEAARAGQVGTLP
ncbi:DUF397 domain-containing protein [Streptomyces echinoruber]|uniref:DUF397 domain-containing protein n=1 Tax=Streptomyces echinoruber TaxID=68898 RepID=A0A918VAD3_9ACTN|nr:DUF397 domain-containing protein [Streptomyces echinoruber]GGZ81055.1 hypothetical protein GCM10010389_18380 [Streptomyces echinoruber]